MTRNPFDHWQIHVLTEDNVKFLTDNKFHKHVAKQYKRIIKLQCTKHNEEQLLSLLSYRVWCQEI